MSGRSPLRAALVAVIAVGLVLLGGGLAVALGIGRDAAPAAGSVDAGFARDMSRHHLQAVEMGNLALDRSTDPAVRSLAFDIAELQANQVGRMQGWLTLWGLPWSGGETMAWMGHGGDAAGTGDGDHADHADHAGAGAGAGADPGVRMPGMASTAELAGLRELEGAVFDVEFLRLMIRHHQGGADMAAYAAEHAGVPAVADLARSMAEGQAVETETMLAMLAARGGEPLPEP